MIRTISLALVLAIFSSIALGAEKELPNAKITGKLDGQLLATGKTVIRADGTGKHLWTKSEGGNCHDIWMLPNGNVLYANGTVFEVDPKNNKVVFEYTPKVTKGGGVYSCQRLENGNTMLGVNSTGTILEVDSKGKEVFKLQLPLAKEGDHHNLRMVRKLDNGNYLACHSGPKLVREYTPKGKIVQEIKPPADAKVAFSAVRLPCGNTLVSYCSGISEYNKKGEVVWNFTPKDLPELALGLLTGLHVLENGNIVVGIYGIKKDAANSAGAFEITRDKKLVWSYSNPKGSRSMMGVQKLDKEGKPLSKKVLR